MTLRIETANGREAAITLHGWLSVAEVESLERAAAGQERVVIDLGQLSGADFDGLRALRRMQDRGAVLAGASPYVRLLLERVGEKDAGR